MSDGRQGRSALHAHSIVPAKATDLPFASGPVAGTRSPNRNEPPPLLKLDSIIDEGPATIVVVMGLPESGTNASARLISSRTPFLRSAG